MIPVRPSSCLVILVLVLTFLASACGPRQVAEANGEPSFPRLSGPYLGQTPPGEAAELFAPGIVTTGIFTRDVAMTPDGKQFFFMASRSRFADGGVEGEPTMTELQKIHAAPRNGQADIYWIDAGFIEQLRPGSGT